MSNFSRHTIGIDNVPVHGRERVALAHVLVEGYAAVYLICMYDRWHGFSTQRDYFMQV